MMLWEFEHCSPGECNIVSLGQDKAGASSWSWQFSRGLVIGGSWTRQWLLSFVVIHRVSGLFHIMLRISLNVSSFHRYVIEFYWSIDFVHNNDSHNFVTTKWSYYSWKVSCQANKYWKVCQFYNVKIVEWNRLYWFKNYQRILLVRLHLCEIKLNHYCCSQLFTYLG